MAEQTRRAGLQMFRAAGARPFDEALASKVFGGPVVDQAATDALPRWNSAAGAAMKLIFGDPDRGGMSLMILWFGSNYVLPRHVHDADCVYYVLSGEAHLGNQVLKAGDGFFAPAGAPYTYTAGPEGVEVLEFRATSTVELRYLESPEGWERLIELADESRDRWAAESVSHR
jgi:mannose-6-phosphate isomerase-like protein (cupin superfamily)